MFVEAYHGTGTLFDSFLCPAYFSAETDVAEFFATRNGVGGFVYDCGFSLSEPLVVDIEGQSWGGFFLEGLVWDLCIEYLAGVGEDADYLKEEGLTVNFLADYAEYAGYDGLIVHGCMEENGTIGTQYVVFNPESIMIMGKALV